MAVKKQSVQVPDLGDLANLKAQVRDIGVQELEALIEDFNEKKYHKKCALVHISEMVKLCFQVDSLDKMKS